MEKTIINEDEQFEIIAKFLNERGPVSHQFDSYEYLVNNVLQKIVSECPCIKYESKILKYSATFGQIYVEKASFVDEKNVSRTIYPDEARKLNINYESPISIDITEQFWDFDEKLGFFPDKPTNTIEHKKIQIMKLPTMVRSSRCNLYGLSTNECTRLKECENCPGGFFIINGKERALVCQERLNYNNIYVFESTDEKYPFIAEIRSMSEETAHSVSIEAKMTKDHKDIVFSLPYMSKDISAGAVFKALGFTSVEIFKFIRPSSKKEIILTDRLIRESITYTNKEKAIKYMSNATIQKVENDDARKIIYAQQVIDNELFPHMGLSTPLEKAILLGTMLNKLFKVCLKIIPPDNRDNVSLKRIEGPCALISDLLRMCLKRFCDSLKKYVARRQDIIIAISRTNNCITSSMNHCFSTGNWSVQKNSYVRTGVSQIMSRLTYPATISHLRRVIIPIGKEGKNVKIRQIDESQIFFIDIIESPEGKSIGIVKNIALSANITTGYNSVIVRDFVEKCENLIDVNNYFQYCDKNIYLIYVNGTLVGMSDNPRGLYSELLLLREYKIFSEQVSFYIDDDLKEIKVFCDSGRYIRPVLTIGEDGLLNLKKTDMSLTWYEMVNRNLIVYIDSNEIEHSLTAMNISDIEKYPEQKFQYCEIHPSLMLGVCSAVIPYSEHNQSPRLIYESSMLKQALGFYSYSYNSRFDAVTHVLHYPQKPLVETRYNKMLHYDEMLSGCNPIVAITTYGGWNQEDSVMLNQSSVDRGMFVHTCYKTIVCEENKKSGCTFEKIEIPPKKIQVNGSNYSKLGKNGIVKKGVPVYKGDVIVGKTLTKVQKDEDEEKNDCSFTISTGEEGIVDEIWEGVNSEGCHMIKIRIRQLRTPEVGDKYASRSSQKGVCGLMVRQEDMPFTSEGIVPDLIMNPHAYPSRMTVSQLLESLSGKVGSLKGQFTDATTFSSSSINPLERISNELKKFGFHKYGNEKLFSGYTGEMMDAEIYIGPTFYQRLKHLVHDKMHSRASGNVTMMHHQPVEGRARDGGLKTGEMERDSLISHGGASMIQETYFTTSDKYQVNVCENCGNIISLPKECRICKTQNIVTTNIPYCAKLLLQELSAMGIGVHIKTVKDI